MNRNKQIIHHVAFNNSQYFCVLQMNYEQNERKKNSLTWWKKNELNDCQFQKWFKIIMELTINKETK